MNEIGEYSVDTDIIGKENVLRELLKGCICCTLKKSLKYNYIRYTNKKDQM